MKNNILKTALLLLVMLVAAGNISIIAGDYKTVGTAGQLDVEQGDVYRIKNFYDAKQEAYDRVATAVKYIERENRIRGEYLYEFTAGEVVAIEGGFEATVIYNSGRTYTVREFYEPKAKAYNTLLTELKLIESQGLFNGVKVASVSKIVEKEGKFSALVTDDNGEKHVVNQYFSPKAEAYNRLLARVNSLKSSGTINGVDVDSTGIIIESTGKFEVEVTDKDGKKYLINESFSPKATAYSNLMARVKNLENSGIINGIAVDKVSDIVESAGKVEVVLTDDNGKKYIFSEYFSARAEAYHSLMIQVKSLKNVGSTINGIAVASVTEIVEKIGKFEAIVTDDKGNKIVVVSFFTPDADEKSTIISLL